MKNINVIKTVALIFLGITSVLVLNPKAKAQSQSTSSVKLTAPELSERTTKKYGAYLAILGDPSPTVAGLNIAYNLSDFMRINLGAGQYSATTSITVDEKGNSSSSDTTVTTVGAGAKFMVPGWNFSPLVGINYSHVFVQGDEDVNVARNNIYTDLGADWQTQSGFNLGFGVNVALTSNGISNPYLNLGWFM